MSTRLRDVMMRELEGLRHEPIEKRIRGMLGDETVLDSTRALLVWEPKRVVPHYAVPEEDVDAELTAAPPAGPGPGAAADIAAPMLAARRVPDPTLPVHGPPRRGRAADAAGAPVRSRGA